MELISISQAKKRFEWMIKKVSCGAVFIITVRGVPKAMLVPCGITIPKRFGEPLALLTPVPASIKKHIAKIKRSGTTK